MPKADPTKEVLAREEKYRLLNDRLEVKTLRLLREADTYLKSTPDTADDNDSVVVVSEKPCNGGDGIPVQCISDTLPRYQVSVDAECNSDEVRKDLDSPLEGVLPEPAKKLSLTAQNRFLVAKVRALEQENQQLIAEFTTCNEENKQTKKRLQEIEEHHNRLHRLTSGHSTQVEKLKKTLSEMRTHCETLDAEKSALKKEEEVLKRATNQHVSEIKSLTTRLNRALEEVDRVKAEMERLRVSSRESTEAGRRNLDQLASENKRLERQKTDLIGAFKKQMRLIDVLRRQKMLIEASKCLQLTEEDFLKSLN